MPLATTAQLVRRAQDHGRGIAAFNVITLEHAEGIVRGAELAGAPVILQISENAVKFFFDALEGEELELPKHLRQQVLGDRRRAGPRQ